ncbi:hypothetical protein GCM10010193_68650 [Kitasatospora atroaurantiaca]|uniref:Uncharacterized protein n=1 Tax=Kitasatospora atroaurantiaca TaxID=285545 RepID=A0A561EKS7_9ACTN|nr:hypothetical protein [Kitasatospora atroaurantiaca]TWE16172.1 hypothetical protein FB465_1139 [Kitasatospora atroaurantiaca]
MNEPTDVDSYPTPDHLLHTGAEHPVDPEDLVMASGRTPTPALIEKARQDLAKYGAAAVERVLP